MRHRAATVLRREPVVPTDDNTRTAVLEQWVVALSAELGLPDGLVPIETLLDVARDAAHSIARPAAPLTTFLVGYAAGVAATGDSAADRAELERLSGVAARFALENPSATA